MTDQQRIAELEQQLNDANTLAKHKHDTATTFMNQVKRLQAENAQLAATVDGLQKHYQIARGRVMANFAHVPEAVRVIDWMDHEMNQACGKEGGMNDRQRIAELSRTIAEFRACLEAWVEYFIGRDQGSERFTQCLWETKNALEKNPKEGV